VISSVSVFIKLSCLWKVWLDCFSSSKSFLYGGIPRKGSSPDEAHRARDDVYGKETRLIEGPIKKMSAKELP
jgi:hypothetical protein